MKKRIAVFASGWASQILAQYLEGLSGALKGQMADTYLFICYPSWASTPEERQGEFNILRLPHLEDFDGVIILSNGLEFNDQINFIVEKCRQSGTPSISLGIKFDGLYYVGVDNASGMRDLCAHLINEHKITHPFFLAGSRDNADSNMRLEVLKDVMKKNNLAFDDSMLFYTDWENSKTIDFVNAYCKSGKPLPDAFICANDGIAMNTCLALDQNGYSVPKDCIVTGFDNLLEAQVYNPSISSVNQNYVRLGKESGNLILKLAEGIPQPQDHIIPSDFHASESCCPSKAGDIDILRRKMCKDYYVNRSYDTLIERKLNYIERMILTGKVFTDIRKNLAETLNYEFSYDSDTFHIVLDPSYEMSIYNSNVEMPVEGYSTYMQVAVSYEKGVISGVETFASRELIPDHKPDDSEHLYVFLPIHDGNATFGYCVLSDCYSKIDSHYLLKYQQRLNMALERYRQKLNLDELNRRLTDITRIDSLTHVKNRMAYQQLEKELLGKIKTDRNVEFGIIMFDVNNLKKINDELGHKAGDEYIIKSSRLICRTFKQSPVFRLGGDEFLAVLQMDDYEHRTELLDSLCTKMQDLQKEGVPLTERISIAYGMTEYNPEADRTVEDVFKRADEIMYKKKIAMKGGDVR